MAVKYFCDRCEKEVPNGRYLTSVRVNRPDFPDGEDKNPIAHKAVCKSCVNEIAAFVNESPVCAC